MWQLFVKISVQDNINHILSHGFVLFVLIDHLGTTWWQNLGERKSLYSLNRKKKVLVPKIYKYTLSESAEGFYYACRKKIVKRNVGHHLVPCECESVLWHFPVWTLQADGRMLILSWDANATWYGWQSKTTGINNVYQTYTKTFLLSPSK